MDVGCIALIRRSGVSHCSYNNKQKMTWKIVNDDTRTRLRAEPNLVVTLTTDDLIC